ncbi:MAG TPA: trypsin-like peptidase domain-containing protein [Chroococcales cyanobacterium]
MHSSDDHESGSSSRGNSDGRFIRSISLLLCAGLIFFIGTWFGLSKKSDHDGKTTTNESGANQGSNSQPASTLGLGRNAGSGQSQNAGGSAGSGGASIFKDNTVATIVKDVSPCVVTIDSVSKPGMQPTFAVGQNSLVQAQPMRLRHMIGTGVVVSPDGYIITCAHLLRSSDQIKVTQTIGTKRTVLAKLVGVDTFTDLALLKIEGSDMPSARLGDSDKLQVGDWVVAIGNPFGFDHTVTFGIISALGRSLDDLNNHAELIQTDAGINTGNSGGPLINMAGDVIGVVVAVRSDAQAIAFACPANVVRKVAEDLRQHGTIPRPFLGLVMSDIDPVMAKAAALPSSTGVLVADVTPNGPSMAAGLMAGDILQTIDGIKISSVKQVREIIARHKPGESVVFTLRRKSGTETRKVNVGSYGKRS